MMARIWRNWDAYQRRQWHPTPILLPGKSHGGGAWWVAVHGVAESRTRLSDFTFTFHFHALEKEMATHSSVFAWRIPGMGEPGGLPSVGLHGVGHDWSDLAAAAVLHREPKEEHEAWESSWETQGEPREPLLALTRGKASLEGLLWLPGGEGYPTGYGTKGTSGWCSCEESSPASCFWWSLNELCLSGGLLSNTYPQLYL